MPSAANAIGEVVLDPRSQLVEAVERRGVASEDLEVGDRAQPGRGRCRGRRAREAAVADGGDPGAEALVRTDGGDREHVRVVEGLLPLHVHADPGHEREPVAEPGVDGVLDVRMRVDEAGHDHAPLVVLTPSDLRCPPDGRDRAVVGDGDGAFPDRLTLDGNDPVRRDDPHSVASSRAGSEESGPAGGSSSSSSSSSP
jgi:hypothetical protein